MMGRAWVGAPVILRKEQWVAASRWTQDLTLWSTEFTRRKALTDTLPTFYHALKIFHILLVFYILHY